MRGGQGLRQIWFISGVRLVPAKELRGVEGPLAETSKIS